MFKPVFFVLCVAVGLGTTAEIKPALPRLVGGNAAVSGQFPHAVNIQTPVAPFCGGVILNVNHILTSCQCVHTTLNQLVNPAFVRIIAGDLNILSPSYRRFTAQASHIYTHQQYNPITRNNDIAVIRVAQNFPMPHNTIDYAERNNHILPTGTNCFFAGWGATTLGGNPTALQNFITTPILDRNACNAAGVHNGLVLENMLCAGSIAAQQPAVGVCTGNLGGGLICNNELTGILSFGIGCGAASSPGVYTQTRFFEQWIQAQFLRTDPTLPGTPVVTSMPMN